MPASQTRDGEKRAWKILGACRGEGGILGEGVRQALLRDPTYVPALDAARELSRHDALHSRSSMDRRRGRRARR